MTTGSDICRARFVVSYRGSAFRGAAASVGVRTVVGDLTAAMQRVLGGVEIDLTLAGRTDAGVHAHGQVISVDLPATVDLDDLTHRLNRMCAPDIAVREPMWVAADFDARFSAQWRRYRYHVWNAPAVEPLLSDLTWHVPFSLDVDAMNRAGEALIGEHDFTSFCRVPDVPESGQVPSMRRRVLDLGWRRRTPPELLRFEIRGTAFCHQMVRSIVGTLVDVGRGRIDVDALAAILNAQNRAQAGQVAPPHGLVLWDVGYDDVGEVQQAPLSSQGSAAGKDRDDSE